MVHRHSVRRDAVDQLLLQGGEEALHPGIVVAMRHAAEALDEAVRRQYLPKSVAGVLAATVTVENSPVDRESACRGLDRVNAQLFSMHRERISPLKQSRMGEMYSLPSAH